MATAAIVTQPTEPTDPNADTASRNDSLRYGARLAASVLLAFAVSAALHLPEGFWAVMSALIVVRPSTGSTLVAGWDRIRGALTGTVLGLAAVAARRFVPGAETASLVPMLLVTLLAFAAGLWPAMRSAPISALIVVTSGGIAGHSAWQVALLRALEIGIGVAAGLLVSLADVRSRATRSFRAAAAAMLLRLADEMMDPAADEGARNAADAERRAAMRRLAGLAEAADREAGLLGRKRREADPERHRRTARLLGRTAHDAALFRRLRSLARDASAEAQERADAAASLRAVAAALSAESVSAPAPKILRAIRPTAEAANVAEALLAQDLHALVRNEGLGPP
jgi:uncharacterized membrane protein YccC